jgi:hypothetical protein
VIIPESACGGSAILSLSQTNTTIITVAENHTTLAVTPDLLHLPVVRTRSYSEAIGVWVALREGLDPNSLNPHIDRIKVK